MISIKYNIDITQDDKAYLHELTIQISNTDGLQCMFVMLMRRYDSKLHSQQYLQDVIVTNHKLLELLDEASKFSDNEGKLKLKDHIEQ